jgi:HEAT repeat protein
LHSQNLHIRNRSMYGLAQVLDRDSRRGDQGEKLRNNREIAQALSDQLVIELRKNSSSKEGIAIQEYLARALGMMDSLDIISPALRMALEPQRDVDIRKSAVVSLSFVAGRAMERGERLNATESIADLVQLSGDSQSLMRQTAAFALGLFDSPEATHQLEVMLGDGDEMTRVNAAIGLARHSSTRGYPVIRDALKESLTAADTQSAVTLGDRFLVVKNALKAVAELASKFDATQRHELVPLVQELAAKHAEMRIQIDATNALNALTAAEIHSGP